VTEPSLPDTPASDPAASREAVDRLMQAHGVEMYRYCMAMLGHDGAALVPTIVGHLQQHAAERGVERLTVLAVAHNRCIERSRTGGRPPSGEGLLGESARVVRALAQLKPVGRDAVVLRSVLGLRWSELERVCGVPSERMLERVCRAWRNAAEVAAGRSVGPGQRPAGRRLGETDEAWAAIRDDARRFVALRSALREAVLRHAPAEGWRDELWQRLEQQREDQLRLASERAAERAAARAAHAAKAAARAAEAERAASPSSAGAAAGPFTAAVDEDEAEATDPPVRTRTWRWLTVGVALALVGLAARWMMLR
jgi:DNA-directed RNA polymerase specialized sigma24 family protein